MDQELDFPWEKALSFPDNQLVVSGRIGLQV